MSSTVTIDGTSITLTPAGSAIQVATAIQSGSTAGATALQPAAITGAAAQIVATPATTAGVAAPLTMTTKHLQPAVAGTDFSGGTVTATGSNNPLTQAAMAALDVNVASFTGGLQAALTYATSLTRPARVSIPGGTYAMPAAIAATLGTSSLSVEAMGRAELNFAAGVNGLNYTNGSNAQTASQHQGVTLNTANSAPGNVAFSLSNPIFGSGGVADESFVEKFRVNGYWGTAFYFDGVPQLTVKDCSVSPPFGTTGIIFFDFECTNSSVISTTYSLLNCRGYTAGYIAVKIGPNIQGMIIDDLSTFGTTYGILLTTGTSASDISSALTIANSNVGAVTVLSIKGNAQSSLIDLEISNSYFYGPAVAGTNFVDIEYVNGVFIDNCEFAPNTPAPFVIGTCNNIQIAVSDITSSLVSLAASNVITIEGGIWNTPLVSGLCQDLTITGTTFESATTFTLTGPNNQITGCNFMAIPNFSGSSVSLASNWFNGVYYPVGAPPSANASNNSFLVPLLIGAGEAPLSVTVVPTSTNYTFSWPTNASVLCLSSIAATQAVIYLPPTPYADQRIAICADAQLNLTLVAGGSNQVFGAPAWIGPNSPLILQAISGGGGVFDWLPIAAGSALSLDAYQDAASTPITLLPDTEILYISGISGPVTINFILNPVTLKKLEIFSENNVVPAFEGGTVVGAPAVIGPNYPCSLIWNGVNWLVVSSNAPPADGEQQVAITSTANTVTVAPDTQTLVLIVESGTTANITLPSSPFSLQSLRIISTASLTLTYVGTTEGVPTTVGLTTPINMVGLGGVWYFAG